MATLPNKNPLADLSGGYYAYWTDGTTEGRATLAVILGSTDAQAAAAALGSLTLGTDLAVAHGGTGASTASDARDNLGLTIGTNVQAWDADLDAIAALDPSANKIIYKGGGANWETATLTSFARTLIDDSNAATARATLGVDAAGTDNSTDVTIAAGLDYITISGQELTLGSVDLTTDVTGALPDGNIATSANWNTAYTHSQVTSGNPHSVTKSDVGLGNVENTALSTWAGSANITTLGTIGTGVWQGTAIANAYVAGIDQNLLTTSSPTFAGLTVNGDVVARDSGTGRTLTMSHSGSTASINNSVAVKGNLSTGGVSVLNWNTDPAPRVGINVSTPSATLHVGGAGVFASTLSIDSDLTLAAGSITSASGAISFGNETITFGGAVTVDVGDVVPMYLDRAGNGQAAQFLVSGTERGSILFSSDSNTTTFGLRSEHGFYLQVNGAVSNDTALTVTSAGDFDFQSGNITTTGAGAFGDTVSIDGTTSVLNIASDGTNSSNAAALNLIENTSSEAFGSSNQFGFQFLLDGSTNNLLLRSGNGATVNTRLSVNRDAGNFDFQAGNITTTGTGTFAGLTVTGNMILAGTGSGVDGSMYLSATNGMVVYVGNTAGGSANDWLLYNGATSSVLANPTGTQDLVAYGNLTLSSGNLFVSSGDLRIGTTSAVGSESLTVNGDQNLSGDLIVGGTEVTLSNLPTADPVNAGQLWNDSGTVKVSAG